MFLCSCVARTHNSKWFYRKTQGFIEISINGKIALNNVTAAWCIGQYAGLRRTGSGFDAALGIDFMHFLMSISGRGGVEVIE